MRREGYSSVSTRRVLGESQDRKLINDLDPDEDTDDIIIFVVQPGSISRYAALCEDSLVVSNKEGSTVKVGQEPVCDVCQCGIDDPVCLKLVETNLIKSTEINDSAHGCECAWENVCEYVVYGSPTLDFNCTAE
jgi:hypothetical protein